MKKYIILTFISALFVFSGCKDLSDEMSSDAPSDFDIKYGIRQVIQYDPVNINGIDLVEKFDFFKTLKLTIHYTNNTISAVTVTNGDIPFWPTGFDFPNGKVECYFDKNTLPNKLRVKETKKDIAYFQNGEFIIPFQLDHSSISYKYTFKSVE